MELSSSRSCTEFALEQIERIKEGRCSLAKRETLNWDVMTRDIAHSILGAWKITASALRLGAIMSEACAAFTRKLFAKYFHQNSIGSVRSVGPEERHIVLAALWYYLKALPIIQKPDYLVFGYGCQTVDVLALSNTANSADSIATEDAKVDALVGQHAVQRNGSIV